MAGKRDWDKSSIPITNSRQHGILVQNVTLHTVVDKLQFGNDVESDIWEFILEHLEEHRQ
jgi:hypothetical protein